MNLQEYIKKILREEFLIEKRISVPQTEIDKSGILFDLLKDNLEKYKKEKIAIDSSQTILKNFFKGRDTNKNETKISVAIYNDDKDKAVARMDVYRNLLLINIYGIIEGNWLNDIDVFENVITHELTHANDPLIKNIEAFSKYFDKKGAELTGATFNISKTAPKSPSEYKKNLQKYRVSQHEYKAYLTPFINELKKVTKEDDYKISVVFWIIEQVKDFSNYYDLYLETFSHFENVEKPIINVSNYENFVYNIFDTVKPWTKKPSLFKNFKKELYLGLKE